MSPRSAPPAEIDDTQTPRFAQRMDGLARQRDQYVAQIAVLRRTNNNRFVEQAWQLLSGRRWSRATAESREKLLQTASWLLILAQRAACFKKEPRTESP